MAVTPKQICDTFNDCLKTNRNPQIGVNKFIEYYRTNCRHPIKVHVYDSHLGRKDEKLLPCGHCSHCRMTKQNEWVTRCFYHLENFKYVYFLTLTLRSFDELDLQDPFNKYLYDYLNNTLDNSCFYHLDSFNAKNHYAYSPCFIPRSVYQNYFKRLRKLGAQFTYFGCCEYGHSFGRPHLHFIIFANLPISKEEFISAWSLQLSMDSCGIVSTSTRNFHKVSARFGRVQVDDLVANGTIGKVNVDGMVLSAKNCFAYVAKYVNKSKYNDSRIKLMFNRLNCCNIQPLIDKYIIDKSNKNLNENEKSLLSSWYKFRKLHSPYLCVSRGTPIGSLYLANHIADVESGNLQPTELQGKKYFVNPSYFRRKASEHYFALRVLSKKCSVGFGNLPALAASMSYHLQCEIPHAISKYIGHNVLTSSFGFQEPDNFKSGFEFKDFRDVECNYEHYLHHPNCFVDLVTKHRYLLVADFIDIKYIDKPGSIHWLRAYEYSYNKSTNKWSQVDDISIDVFCDRYFSQMTYDFEKYTRLTNRAKLNRIWLDELKVYDDTFGLNLDDVLFNLDNKLIKENDNIEQLRFINSNL